MKTTSLCQKLLRTDQLHIHQLEISRGCINLQVESKKSASNCPACGGISRQIHSRYVRHPVDLAWADFRVVLDLQVKRYFCRNVRCPKRTFAERFPDLVARYARRTDRVLERQREVSLRVCARAAEQLLRMLHFGLSDTSINRLLRALPERTISKLRVVGIDDWAKRKGQRYGTIVVDLERGQIVDLLENRTAETVAAWLTEHETIEIVSRDRSKTYAEAIAQGAPDAVQVADRWHLLKNLSDTVYKLFQKESVVIKSRLKSEIRAKLDVRGEKRPGERLDEAKPPLLTLAEQRRERRMRRTQELHELGWRQKEIAKELNIHPKTVRRYLRYPDPISRRAKRVRLIDPYKSYLLMRWNEGCRNATQLFREIQAKGYAGEATIVRDHVRELRKTKAAYLETDPTERAPSLRALVWYLLRRPEDRKDEHEQVLQRIAQGRASLETTINLARSFARMVRKRQEEKLDDWLNQAVDSGIPIWRNFAAGLDQDLEAVRAALALEWSNGPTEGFINRLKCLKCQLYGRAKDDLLRKRLLWQNQWSFT